MGRTGPAVLVPYDPTWPDIADRLIDQLRAAGAPTSWIFDHIGSTAVPGLAAKNNIDLQIRTPLLPTYAELDATIGPLGYVGETGARADSPGVYRDTPRGSDMVAADVWEKRLYVRPGQPFVILHVRRLDSPFGRYTVWFRDWLRAHDDQRDRYAAVKRQLAEVHAADPDYDDYTRAKTAYLDDVQPAFEAWVRRRDAR